MAKGGGAWKVAYADFVTAMMAFFLVMWICSQDQKVKQAVARYFVTPIGIVETGASSRPNRTGAIFPAPTSGSVPDSEAVALGRGRVAHTPPTDVGSHATKVISDWMRTTAMDTYWQREVEFARDYAAMSKDLLQAPGAHHDVAKRQLTRNLREQICRRVHSEHSELSEELLTQVLSEVNWEELAEDLLSQDGGPKSPSR